MNIKDYKIFLKALNATSWKDFWSKGDSSHFENSPSFKNSLDLGWCLSNKWKLHSATVRVVWWAFRPIRMSNSYKLNIYHIAKIDCDLRAGKSGQAKPPSPFSWKESSLYTWNPKRGLSLLKLCYWSLPVNVNEGKITKNDVCEQKFFPWTFFDWAVRCPMPDHVMIPLRIVPFKFSNSRMHTNK